MFLLMQLAASYKSPFSVARDQTYEEPGTLWWSLPASLWYTWIRYKWKHREKWIHLLKMCSIRKKRTADGSPVSNQGAIRFKVERDRESFPSSMSFYTRSLWSHCSCPALPQRPSERLLLQLSAVNSRRKTLESTGADTKWKLSVLFLHLSISLKERGQRRVSGAFCLENLQHFNGLNWNNTSPSLGTLRW